MTADETLAYADADRTEAAPECFSRAWWHDRSHEELREFLDRGFGSAGFEGATAEAERRAREQRRAEDEAARQMAARKKSLRLGILEALLLGCLVAVIAILLAR
ncbi:MAG TPA: hypothetical protein VFK28_12610 [Sphingomicrobium sp.]|jgi:hypothetical protein|nr:hypothetical protein [Sphingomicrobium sp.]